MAINDIRTIFTLLGTNDLFGVDVEAEEIFEHREAEEVFEHREAEEVFEQREAEEVFEHREAEEVFEHREAEELFEHREAEEVFEHRTYVLWNLRTDDELFFNSIIFEDITWHNTNS
jgi:hypothetical protein